MQSWHVYEFTDKNFVDTQSLYLLAWAHSTKLRSIFVSFNTLIQLITEVVKHDLNPWSWFRKKEMVYYISILLH